MELQAFQLKPEMVNEDFYQKFQNIFHEGKIYLLETREYNIPNSDNNTREERESIPITVNIFLYLDNDKQYHIAAMDSCRFNEFFVKVSTNE